MYFGRDADGAITLNFGATPSSGAKMIIGKDDQGYIILSYSDGTSPYGDFPNYGRDVCGGRIITCTNDEGYAAIFTEQKLDPFILCKAEGIYTIENNLSIKENTMIDGGTFLGSIMRPRNIVLTLKDIEGHDANRELIDTVFNKRKPGIMVVQDGSHIRSIEYYVESITSTATPVTRITTISLMCPDPYFYDPNETQVYIADLVPSFTFAHEFEQYGEEIGHFGERKYGVIKNQSAHDGVGLTMMLKAFGDVTNPVLTLMETGEKLAMGNASHPFSMVYGDRILFNTQTGHKNVYDIEGNSINAHLTEDSTFFQLKRGNNTIGYGADVGADNFATIITYRNQYVRA